MTLSQNSKSNRPHFLRTKAHWTVSSPKAITNQPHLEKKPQVCIGEPMKKKKNGRNFASLWGHRVLLFAALVHIIESKAECHDKNGDVSR